MNEHYQMHGIVKIYDENHNLVQEKNNMIVKTGREKIMKMVFEKASAPSFKYFYETGNTTNLTTPDTTFDKLTAPHDANFSQPASGEEKLSYKYTAKIEWDSDQNQYEPILAVGLYWEENGVKNLFSRAAIDPVYMLPNRTYTIEHSIYF